MEEIINMFIGKVKRKLALELLSSLCLERGNEREESTRPFPFGIIHFLYHRIPTLLLPISPAVAIALKEVRYHFYKSRTGHLLFLSLMWYKAKSCILW